MAESKPSYTNQSELYKQMSPHPEVPGSIATAKEPYSEMPPEDGILEGTANLSRDVWVYKETKAEDAYIKLYKKEFPELVKDQSVAQDKYIILSRPPKGSSKGLIHLYEALQAATHQKKLHSSYISVEDLVRQDKRKEARRPRVYDDLAFRANADYVKSKLRHLAGCRFRAIVAEGDLRGRAAMVTSIDEVKGTVVIEGRWNGIYEERIIPVFYLLNEDKI